MGSIRLAVLSLFMFVLSSAVSAQNQFEVDRNTVEQWIFQQQGTAIEGRKHLESQLSLELRMLQNSLQLDDTQIAKIELAGKGDIKRFFDRISEVVSKIEAMELNQNQINEAYQLTIPIATEVNGGLFTESSLMHKVLHGSISEEQSQLLITEAKLRRRLLIESLIKGYVLTLGRSVPMTADQSRKVIEILVAKTENDRLAGQYASFLIAYRWSRVPEEELQTFLHEKQIKAMKKGKAEMNGMLQFFKQQGMIVDEVQIDE
jgi:hypothetical protein